MKKENKKIVRGCGRNFLPGIFVFGIVTVMMAYMLYAGMGMRWVKAAAQDEKSNESSVEKQLTDELEMSSLQDMVDDMLGEKSFSIVDAFQRLLSGEEILSEESVQEFLHSLLFSGFEKEKE